jgi:hypothetical protein
VLRNPPTTTLSIGRCAKPVRTQSFFFGLFGLFSRLLLLSLLLRVSVLGSAWGVLCGGFHVMVGQFGRRSFTMLLSL